MLVIKESLGFCSLELYIFNSRFLRDYQGVVLHYCKADSWVESSVHLHSPTSPLTVVMASASKQLMYRYKVNETNTVLSYQ